jgi:hypothetical protein
VTQVVAYRVASDHARAEQTRLVCSACNALLNDLEFKSRSTAFEAYQLALRRVLQAHHAHHSSIAELQGVPW